MPSFRIIYPLEFTGVRGEDKKRLDRCVWLASVSNSFGWDTGRISVAYGAESLGGFIQESTR